MVADIFDDEGNNEIAQQTSDILQFVKDHVRYVRDPIGLEFVQSPLDMVRTIKARGFTYGDCEDHTILLNTLLGAIGIKARPVGVKLGDSKSYNHVVTTALGKDGIWKTLDACAKNRPQPQYTDRLMAD